MRRVSSCHQQVTEPAVATAASSQRGAVEGSGREAKRRRLFSADSRSTEVKRTDANSPTQVDVEDDDSEDDIGPSGLTGRERKIWIRRYQQALTYLIHHCPIYLLDAAIDLVLIIISQSARNRHKIAMHPAIRRWVPLPTNEPPPSMLMSMVLEATGSVDESS